MKDLVFLASIDSIITTDVNGIITDLNPAAEIMLEFSKGELIGTSIKELYVFESESKEVLAEIVKTGKFNGTIVNRTKSGKEINSLLSANYIYNKDGDIVGTMGISRDITNNISLQKKHEQLISTVSDIIYSSNLEGYFTYVNKTVKKTLGFYPEELIGVNFKDLIYKPHLNAVNQHYQNHFEKKLEQSYFEFQIVKKDGSLLWVGQQTSTKFSSIHKNKIDGFYGVVRDIDDQKKTELLLAKSEEKYRELFDNSSDLIQSVDLNGNFLYINNSWKRTLGYSEEEMMNLNLFALVHPGSKELCSVLFDNISQSGECKEERVIYDLVAKNGNRITVEGAITITKTNGVPVSIQSFLRDVTKQKEIENKLFEREKTLSQITETLADVFFFYNIVEKKYEYISSNCKAVLGINSDPFCSEKSQSRFFCHPNDNDKLLEANHGLLLGDSYSIDYQILVDNKTRWINEKSFPIYDEIGKVVANSGICRDITDLINAADIINEQNIEIHDSIRYAKRLQESVLPNRKDVLDIIPDSFVLYKPKDAVSGDFYVVDYIRNNHNLIMPTIIVGDCTGHGVPGAMLSLMCNVLVRESFTRQEVNTPADALEFVRKRLVQFFKADNDKRILDGMDIAFCVLNKSENLLYFSGGFNSCVILRDKEIKEYKGDRQHIGFSDNPKPFNNHIIEVKSGDQIYLYTDGYLDQFGGERGKKFTKKRLHNLLLEICHLPMHEIGVKLEVEFFKWKKDLDQIDDVTIVGLRVD